MSMPSAYVRCHGCNFEGVMPRRPITLEYLLPGGDIVQGYRRFAWCSSCEDITEAEKPLDSASIQAEIDSLKPEHVGFFTRIFGNGDPAASKRDYLQAKLRLAKIRRSHPRCLRCGEATVVPLAFDTSGTSSIVHTCGKRLFLVPEDPYAIRFNFVPEVIRLDPEGRRL